MTLVINTGFETAKNEESGSDVDTYFPQINTRAVLSEKCWKKHNNAGLL